MRFIFCEICHRQHWLHYHLRAEVLFGFEDPQGDVEMSADAIDVVFPVVTFYGSVGALTDAEGNVVEDTVASATWTAADTLVTVAANPNNAVDAVFTAIGNGVVPITVTGTTAAGSQVTGDGTATITGFGTTVGPAVKVAVDLSLTDPDSAPAAVPAAPGFPAT